MRKSTVLAMPFPLTNSNGFDFTAFLKCKPYLSSKDQRITTFITQKILEILDQNQQFIRVLDVGSGDATVIAQVCQQLNPFVHNVSYPKFRVTVDCVEPCPDGIKLIRQMATKATDSEILMIPRHSTIENFLINETYNYDVIICCHALYHIERSKWNSILKGLMSILNPGGILIVNLVSRQSDIYRIKDKIERIDGYQNLPKMYRRYGYDYYAEDLEDNLSQFKNTFKEKIITSNISFSQEDVCEAIKELHIGSHNSSLLQFLAFMFRLQYNDLLSIGKSILMEHLIPASEGIIFKSIDKMFLFKRTNYK